MAKKEIAYYCEICGKKYNDELDAIGCENDHLIPVEIIKCKFDINDKAFYPSTINIKLRDFHGNTKIVEYTRKNN